MLLTPLHTRTISLRLAWAEPGYAVAEGRVLDLRKRGLVPLAAKLQGPGVVHDIAVSVRLEVATRNIVAITPTMSAYPFDPGPATFGEGCPNILPRVQSLLGCDLGDEFAGRVFANIGGPRGCFHIYTVMRLLGPSIRQALDSEARRRSAAGMASVIPAPGSPIFSRSVIVDGARGEGLRLALRGMLFDLYYVPGAEVLPLEEEMAASMEAIADVEVEVPGMAILSASGRRRQSGHAIENPGAWTDVPDAGQLVGLTMYRGYSSAVEKRVAADDDGGAFQHLLFMLAPTLIQCMPSLMDEVEWRPRRAEGARGAVDSCHMWRDNGPLLRLSDPTATQE